MTLPTQANGNLSSFTMVGGYPIYYMDGQGNVLCASCANEARDNDDSHGCQPVAAGVNWEDACLYCDECSDRIASAYAEEETS